jgi:hypothetical protein
MWFLYLLPSLVVGLASGFQGIAERYTSEASLAVRTTPAVLYLLSRSVVSSLGFLLLYSQGYIQTTSPLRILAYSASCGLGAEAVLRSKFNFTGGGKQDPDDKELLFGVFDGLKWYQDRWLQRIGIHLTSKRLKVFNKFVPKGMGLTALCNRVETNLPALKDENERKTIREGLTNLKAKYADLTQFTGTPEEIELRHRIELGSLIYDSTAGGKETLKTLLS